MIQNKYTCTVEPAMSSHSSEQPHMVGHFANRQIDVLYTNEPSMSSHLP